MRPYSKYFHAKSIVVALLTYSIPASHAANSSATPKVVASEGVDCTDPHAQADPSCWNTLGLTDFLYNWNQSTPTCPGLNTSACCVDGEAWSTCFLRLTQTSAGGSCYNIPGCVNEVGGLSEDLPKEDLPKYRYVIYNIQAVNYFFTTWYWALEFAFSQASSAISGIVEIVAPEKKTSVALSDVLLALTIGLGLITGPELEGVDEAAQIASTLFVKLATRIPTVAKAVWPTGTTDSQLFQIAELSEKASIVTSEMEEVLNNGNQLVEGNLTTFIEFVSGGQFSVPEDQWPSLPNKTEGLYLALTTFLISSAIAGNGWNAAIIPDLNPLQTTETGELPSLWANISCTECNKLTNLHCTSYDSKNLCGRWWFDSKLNSTFTLGGRSGDPASMMSQILNSNWTTGPLLFRNAGTCDVRKDSSFAIPFGSAVINSTNLPLTAQQNIIESQHFWIDYALTAMGGGSNAAGQISWKGLSNESVGANGTLRADMYTYIGEYPNHPANTLINYTDTGIDFSCTSQLNLRVITSWEDVYYQDFFKYT